MKRSRPSFGQPASRSRKRILGAGHALGAAERGVAAAEQRLGLEIERAQELALPSGPHAGPDGADVGHREQQQQLQPLPALHQGGKVAQGLGVVEVAALGEQAHGEMMLDQPGGGLGLGRREAEAGPELAGNAAAGDGMILVTALGDVMDKGRDVKRAAIVDGADDLARYRVLGGEASHARCRTGSRWCGSGARPR